MHKLVRRLLIALKLPMSMTAEERAEMENVTRRMHQEARELLKRRPKRFGK